MGFLSKVVLVKICPSAHPIRDESREKEHNARIMRRSYHLAKFANSIIFHVVSVRKQQATASLKHHLITKQKKAASVAEAPIANTTTLVPLAKIPPTA